jgi:hypothetical protein
MGGKTSTSTQSVQVPQSVLNNYNQAYGTAQAAADQPFQTYGGQFVAPLTGTQQAGIANVNQAAGAAQPYYGAATGELIGAQQSAMPYYGQATGNVGAAQNVGNELAMQSLGSLAQGQYSAMPLQYQAAGNYQQASNAPQALNQAAAQQYYQGLGAAAPLNAQAQALAQQSAGQVNATPIDANAINQYMSPYLSSVVGAQEQLLNQQNQQAMSGQLGNAIQAGAFGGDRSGVAAANLAQQQQIANANIYSNLLNQGYSQALSAAQQQQGVGLSAAQANRAAVASAAQQLAGLGQQQYTQQTGTGQNLAALGQQVYAQPLGIGQAQSALAQQLYGQGATTAQQQAALGQQQYAQGIGAAQQLQGIGQGLYGMGSGTSASLANLGQGAQNAAIQGGQAQLAAGTTEQQTQQALNQALYNQFLQQQAYPFQTSQFLTNAALGLGTAQGSTTTTTQPGGFFSDKRLKENIQEIGKDFSGKKLYRFNYKGDDKTHVGYIAQEIEKSTPEAVGESHGYKTVDYGKASEEAADRGHYYSGGVVPQSMGGHVAEEHSGEGYAPGGYVSAPGNIVSPMDFASILAAQQQMFGPEAQSGRNIGGMPGANGVVPAANIPVSHIATAPSLSQPRNALENIKQITDAAQGLNKTYTTFKKPVEDFYDKYIGGQSSSSTTPNAKNGGRIQGLAAGGIPYESEELGPHFGIPEEAGSHRLSALQFSSGGLAGYAAGGSSDLPYESGENKTSLDIPNENKNDNKPQTAAGLAPQPTGLQNLSEAASTAAGIAKIAAMFMASGGVAGRPHKADAGSVGDDSDENAPQQIPAVKLAKDNSGLAAAAAAPPPAESNAASGLGKAALPEKTDKASAWYKDPDKFIPLLSGLAAMGTAPTRNLGVALASGLGAGAQSYQQQRQFGLEQQKLGISQMQAANNVITNRMNVLSTLRQQKAALEATGKDTSAIDSQIANLTSSLMPLLGTNVSPLIQPTKAQSISAPAAAQPAAAQPAATQPAAAQAVTAGTPQAKAEKPKNIYDQAFGQYPEFWNALDPNYNPDILLRRGQAALAADPNSTLGKDLITRAQNLKNEITQVTGTGIDKNGNVIEYPGFKPLQTLKENSKSNEALFASEAQNSQQRAQTLAQLQAIQKVLENYQSGRGAGALADLSGYLRTAGIPVPEKAMNNTAEFDTFLKNTMQSVFSQAASLPGSVKLGELEGLKQASANPSLDPVANREVLAESIGYIKHANDRFDAMNDERASHHMYFDPATFQQNWGPTHNLKDYINDAKKDIAVRGVATSNPANFEGMEEGGTYILEPGTLIGPNKTPLKDPIKVRVVRDPKTNNLTYQRVN